MRLFWSVNHQDDILFLQRSLVRGVNPVIQEWMIGISRQELNRMLPQVSIQPFALERYIVRGSSMDVESATSPENMETSPAASANSETVSVAREWDD